MKIRILLVILIACLSQRAMSQEAVSQEAVSQEQMSQTLVSGNFELIDHRGNQVTQASYNGKVRLVFFGFTSCPVICPTTMTDIVQTMSKLGPMSEQVQPLLITIDPSVDDVARLAEYVATFHPQIVGLTGSKAQIAAAAKSFNATFGRSKSSADGNGAIFHSAFIYLMDEQGKFIDLFGYGAPPSKITKKIKEYLIP